MNGSKIKEEEEEEKTLKPSSIQLFQSTIAKISVAQICQSIGFTSFQTSALESFSNIATRYLETLAKSASLSANSSGRTECNLFDVIQAIEDMNSIRGFVGATNMKKSLLKSGVLKEIRSFVRFVDEIPFAKPIPRRNLKKSLVLSRVEDQVQRFSHIPAWLPSLPDVSTYKKIQKEERIGFNEVEKDRGVVDCSVEKNVNVEKKESFFLPVKRPKVKFKFGLNSNLGVNVELGTRNGVCRGGKRVSCHDLSEEDDIKSFKRKR
ncbi:Transcription initiation factor tfiid subunit [Thalictrum thalictroides]|uniref:Transcription initiation factor tfiid subunit n=1 Tax=Thalictrum thalictroides TaxID=46969 RepID=A0A7J6VTL7_THATH|nr:Transcription initiation factor tfiid subunit [Thalictrum thalictroides]